MTFVLTNLLYSGKNDNLSNSCELWIAAVMCGSCHLDRVLNGEIGVEYQMIFVDLIFKCFCEIHFGTPLRFRKGFVI